MGQAPWCDIKRTPSPWVNFINSSKIQSGNQT